MELKGHARLRLFDKETGREVFREEHDNTITPALARIFAGDLAGTLNYAKLMPVLEKLIGGVCLFNGTVSSSDVFLPRAENASLTAHAGQNGYYDPLTDLKKGTPGNSGPIRNGYRWTWTWANTQGNGQITDVCLTHADTGDYWNENTPNTMADDFDPIADVSNGVINPAQFGWTTSGVQFAHITNEEKIPIGFYGDVDHVVTIEAQENNILVHIGKFTGSGAWIWNELADIEDEKTITFSPTPWQWGDFESFGIGAFYIAYDSENKKLYAITVGQSTGQTTGEGIYRPYNTDIIINSLNLETLATDRQTVSCATTINNFHDYVRTDGESFPSDVVFYVGGTPTQQDRNFKQIQVVDGSIFLPIFWLAGILGTTDCSIRINLEDPTEQEIVKGLQTIPGNYTRDSSQIDLGHGRIMNLDSMAWKDNAGNYKGQSVPLNTSVFPFDFTTSRGFTAKQPSDSPIQYFTFCYGTTEGIRGCILNKLYQATVFHIENGPLVKNSSQTMILEYEITQEDDES